MSKIKSRKNKKIIIVTSFVFLAAIVLFLYKIIFPISFKPDTNEISAIPDDVLNFEKQVADKSNLDKSHIKLLEDNLLDSSKTKARLSVRVPILLYHYVEYVKDRGDKIRISLDILPSTFDLQIKTLKDAGYTFLVPSDIPDLLSGKKDMPDKPIILSFDDGYRDFYTDVFPVLKKYGVKAVAYIVPGFLDKPNNLTHIQLRDIASSGLVEIGAHTINHAYLKGLNEQRVQLEVEQSKAFLEKELKRPVVSFAYPYGAFDINAVLAVKKAGFKTAVSTAPGVEINYKNLFFMYRLRPGARTGQALLQFLAQTKFPN